MLIQESNDRCTVEMKECETVRQQHLIQIGNTLHPSVPISDNEVGVWVDGGGEWEGVLLMGVQHHVQIGNTFHHQ